MAEPAPTDRANPAAAAPATAADWIRRLAQEYPEREFPFTGWMIEQTRLAIEAEAAAHPAGSIDVDGGGILADSREDHLQRSTAPAAPATTAGRDLAAEVQAAFHLGPDEVVGLHQRIVAIEAEAAALDVDALARWLKGAYGHAFRDVDWLADAEELASVLTERRDA